MLEIFKIVNTTKIMKIILNVLINSLYLHFLFRVILEVSCKYKTISSFNR
nr:MAG TPA: hypothetical protein [Caudoviricetes sp.]